MAPLKTLFVFDVGKKRSITTTVLVIVFPSAAALVFVLSICIFFRRRISRKKSFCKYRKR